jgi:hypothetical protein
MSNTSSYRVQKDRAGNKEVVWSNTNIDKPTLGEAIRAALREFPGVPVDNLGLLSGIISLTMKEGHSIL